MVAKFLSWLRLLAGDYIFLEEQKKVFLRA
jgi:hypothetical protein